MKKPTANRFREAWMRSYHRIHQHVYDIEGKTYRPVHLFGTGEMIDIWFDSLETMKLINQLPYHESIITVLDEYRKTNEILFDDVLIIGEKNKEDNWFYPDDSMWVLTIPAIALILRTVLESRKIDVSHLDHYFIKENVKGVW